MASRDDEQHQPAPQPAERTEPAERTQPAERTETQEIDLEPVHLIAKSDAILRMGALMLSSGTGSFRVKQAMIRVSKAIGIDRLRAQVSLSEIVATTTIGQIFRTQVAEVAVPGVNADRIAALERLWRGVRPGMTVQDLNAQLDTVERRKRLYGTWAVVGAAAMACAAFSFLNNGTWLECLAVALAAALGKYVQVLLSKFRINQLAVVMLSATAACAGYAIGAWLIHQLPFTAGPLHDAAFTSSVLFLVPGFPLMTAALDLARLDFTAGISRLTYALLIIMSASLGAWAVAGAFGLAPAAAPEPDIAPLLLSLLRVLAGFFGVLGFAITFNTPMRIAMVAAAIGGIANCIRLGLVDLGMPLQVPAAIATFLVGMLAFIVTHFFESPRITLSVPAVLIMIPGASVYRALVFFNEGQILKALENGIQATFVVVSLAVGLTVARMLTDREWTLDRIR